MPTVPAAARANTSAGAEAFARFYLELVNEAWMRPDPDLLRPYVLSSCRTCANDIRTAADLRRRGQRYGGKAASLGTSVVAPEHARGQRTVQIVMRQLRQHIYDKQGRVVERVPSSTAVVEVTVSRASDLWRVNTIRVLRV